MKDKCIHEIDYSQTLLFNPSKFRCKNCLECFTQEEINEFKEIKND